MGELLGRMPGRATVRRPWAMCDDMRLRGAQQFSSVVQCRATSIHHKQTLRETLPFRPAKRLSHDPAVQLSCPMSRSFHRSSSALICTSLLSHTEASSNPAVQLSCSISHSFHRTHKLREALQFGSAVQCREASTTHRSFWEPRRSVQSFNSARLRSQAEASRSPTVQFSWSMSRGFYRKHRLREILLFSAVAHFHKVSSK